MVDEPTQNRNTERGFVKQRQKYIHVCSEVKQQMRSRSESESEEGDKLHAVDPKPGELAMARVKYR